jgi:hypothetical protein
MCRAVIWELGGFHIESISSYRRSLVSNLNLAANTMAKIQSEFAIFYYTVVVKVALLKFNSSWRLG